MTEAVLNKCENGCEVEINYSKLAWDDRLWMHARINLFCEAVEADGRLKILDTTVEDYGECFVIDDTRSDNDQILFMVSEVLEKCTSKNVAERMVRCLLGEEKAIILNGITRIVGYYSRVQNYNKSKIGELRDRHQANYRVEAGKIEFGDQRKKAIDGLSMLG